MVYLTGSLRTSWQCVLESFSPRMFDVGCWKLGVRCSMFDVRRSVFDVRCFSAKESGCAHYCACSSRQALGRNAIGQDVRSRRRFHAFAQVEARMRGLVVADVLPRDGETVLRVVHQGTEPMLRRDGGGVDAQLLVVGGAPDDFLTPVPEQVRAQAGRGFAPVVRQAA